MGGGKALFERQKQYEAFTKQLDAVTFYVRFPFGGNLSLLDSNKFQKDVAKEVLSTLEKNSIKCREIMYEAGGGRMTLLEVLKSLWSCKDLISSLAFLPNLTKRLYEELIQNNVNYLRPLTYIHLQIGANCETNKISKTDINDVITKKLANLFLAACDVKRNLLYCFPYYRFNVLAEVNLNPGDAIIISIDVPEQPQSKTGINRLLKIIKNVKLKPNTISNYKLHPSGIVRRHDEKLIDSQVEKNRNYYLVISDNIISDYLK